MDHATIELEDFKEILDIIRNHGFNPIGISQMAGYDTVIFNTDAEALNGYEKLEVEEKKLFLNWYGKEQWVIDVEEYEKEFGTKVKTIWI